VGLLNGVRPGLQFAGSPAVVARSSGQSRATSSFLAFSSAFQYRLEKRMEVPQRVKLEGFEIDISELETEMDYLRRASRYLED
jgi:hypothetical protein